MFNQAVWISSIFKMPASTIASRERKSIIIYLPGYGLLDSYLLTAVVLVDPVDRLRVKDDPFIANAPLNQITDIEYAAGMGLVIALRHLPLPCPRICLPRGVHFCLC